MNWTNDLYKNDPQHLGTAIALGHAAQLASWQTAETKIAIIHSGEKFKNTVAIQYTSLAFGAQIDAEREEKNLSDL